MTDLLVMTYYYDDKNNETKSYASILKYNFFIRTDGLTELLVMTWLS